MKRRTLQTPAWLLVSVLFFSPAFAADFNEDTSQLAAARSFVPVQAGPSQNGQTLLPYAENRLLVKFTEQAAKRVPLNLSPGKGASTGPRTGILSVDAISQSVGVSRIERPYEAPKNQLAAQRLGVDRWYMFRVQSGTNIVELADRYAADPNVESASPDWRAFPAATPNDPIYSSQWGHNNTAQMLDYCWQCGGHPNGSPVGTVGFDANAEAAWDKSQGYGSSSVIIAILDSGVDVGHPDLDQVAGYDYGDNDSNPDDDSADQGHGTACAGVAAGISNNGVGVSGVAGGSRIMPLKVSDSGGSLFFSYIQNALYHAADNGADIASMSFGAAISSDPATDTALQYAYDNGVVMLAATGNENATSIGYPANNANVIAVGAASPCGERKRSSSSSSELNPGVSADPNGYTCDGERWWGSSYGSTTQDSRFAVDVIAPTIMPTTDIQGSAGYDPSNYSMWFNGTSCSTPYAAGVCALILSANPGFTPMQVRQQLTSTAQDVVSVESGSGWDRYTGYGMVDADAAVGGGGGPGDTVTLTAPNGGEVLQGGASTTITWTSTGTISNVALEYSTNGGGSYSLITSSTPNDGSFNWTVPASATTQGRVRVSDASDPGVNDASNGNFTIQVLAYATLPYTTGFEGGAVDSYWTLTEGTEGRIRVLSSNGPHSGSWHLVMDDDTNGGSYSQNEGWLHLNLSGEGDVDLEFWWKDFSDETHSQDGIYFSDNGGGSFTKVHNLNGGSTPNNTWQQVSLDLDALAGSAGLSLSSTFVVKFQQYDNYGITTDGMAFDDIAVTSVAPPVNSVTLTAPNGGEVLTAGNSTNITWTSVGSISNVSLEYSTNGGSSWNSITSSTPNDGTFSWSVPASATTQGRVRVADAADAGTNDISDGNFTIDVPPANSVTVTAPNGGETLTGGNATNITWSSTGSISNVSLDYSTNGGSSWTSITASTPNDGTFSWTVPTTATTQGRVRVADAADAGTNDISNSNFTIEYTPPTGDYASIPYNTGFESGSLDQYWATTEGAEGRIQVTTANGPQGGSYHLTMDDDTNGGSYSQNEAWLHLDLAGETQVDLSFYWKEFGDETHAQDGVYLSDDDGASFVKVLDLPGQSFTNNTWQFFQVDIDAAAAANGLNLTGTFVVKFQQYDNYGITTDGHAIDDVSVTEGSTGGGDYATLPYSTGFESGTLDQNWVTQSTSNGRVRVISSNQPRTGSYQMAMDDPTSGGFAQNEAWMRLDLSGQSQVTLDFYWKEFGDENHSQDGVYFSDNGGSSFVKVLSLNGQSYTNNTWQNFTLDVDALASSNGLSLTSTFVVKFQQYDNYPIATDGHAYDDISVTGSPTKGDEIAAPVPTVFALHPNYPNPFNPQTTIQFDVPRPSNVRLNIYDMRGRLVKTLTNEQYAPGVHTVVWNGVDRSGSRVSSGIYIYRIEAEGFGETRKMTLLK